MSATASTSAPSSAEQVARRAKAAFEEAQKRLPRGQAGDVARSEALHEIRKALEVAKEEIKQANAKDMQAAQALVAAGTLSSSLVARLDLFSKPGKWEGMLEGLTQVAELPTPLDKCTYAKRLAEADQEGKRGALDLYRVTCPIGVLLCIFEARPEVIINIASLAIKSGNAAILKGGKESRNTAAVMSRILAQALSSTTLPSDMVQTVETRDDIAALLHQDRYIDLVIPRGSNELVRSIQREARMPVMGHADGLCAIYVHEDADASMVVPGVLDSKLDYPAACNAVETLLLHQATLSTLWPALAEKLIQSKVTLYCDEPSLSAISSLSSFSSSEHLQPSRSEHYDTEFLDACLAVKVVSTPEEAVDHINTHGSHHTDAIYCSPLPNESATTSPSSSATTTAAAAAAAESEESEESSPTAAYFVRSITSANVFINCSTRFADGFRYGFGTEVGISTGRTHARGPVGLEGLVTYRYVARASSAGRQIAAEFAAKGDEARQWSHREIRKEYPPL